MKRLTIFTHHDKDNIIDDYIIFLLKYMNELSDIIFVSNNNLNEINKINNKREACLYEETKIFQILTSLGFKLEVSACGVTQRNKRTIFKII